MPSFDIRTRRGPDGALQVWDPLRSKFVALTPEEWVRQHFVHFLCEHRGYPAALMANEVAINHNGTRRRCDTVVYDRQARPAAIVEYKAPEVSVTPKVFDQIVRYNMVLGVRLLIVSNGISHYCCRCPGDGTYHFLRDIPSYPALLADTK